MSDQNLQSCATAHCHVVTVYDKTALHPKSVVLRWCTNVIFTRCFSLRAFYVRHRN